VARLKITLVRSLSKTKEDQAATIKALGLKKIGCSVEREDIPQVRGMIRKVSHLVSVEEI